MANRDDDDINPFAAPQADLVSREEEHLDDGERGHRVIDAGEVISASVEIFKSSFGIAIGGFLVAAILSQLCSLPQVIASAIGEMLANQGNKEGALICQGVAALLVFAGVAGQLLLQVGQARLMLNIAQGKNAQIGDLFTGGKYFWRMLGSSIVLGILALLGFLACIVPGVIVSLMFSTYVYALIDQDSPGLECLSVARAASKENLLTLFVIGLAAFGFNILGFLALCVGLLATIPLTTLFIPVAYCKMTGQRTAESM
jgi:hypothetical protein